jgi:hypothetical protein
LCFHIAIIWKRLCEKKILLCNNVLKLNLNFGNVFQLFPRCSELTTTITPWRMDDKWSKNSFQLILIPYLIMVVSWIIFTTYLLITHKVVSKHVVFKKSLTYLQTIYLINNFTYLSTYIQYLFLTKWVTNVKLDVNSINVHPQLNG